MPNAIRPVSDGEELLLSEGEEYRVVSGTDARQVIAERRSSPTAPKQPSIRYVGFQDVEGRREYAFLAERGDEARRYILRIELSAFSTRRAQMQDGPDICYQKLLRELASGPEASDVVAVTEADLAAYKESHTPTPRRRFSAPRT
jgi:hypothetical protein